MTGITCLLNGSRGIYIPQSFVECFDAEAWHVSAEDAEILRAGPDHELYWEAWADVVDHAEFTDDDDNRWVLSQDDDLFAICFELMTDDEKQSFGFED